MKIFMILGWRNLWRQKKRSLIVVTSIAIGLFGMLFASGFMNSMSRQMVDNTISTSLGHTAIHRKGFQDNMKLEYNFEFTEKIEKSLKENSHLKSYAPRVKIQGMVRSSEASRGVMIVGISPEKEKAISKIYDYTIKKEGSRYLSPDNPNSIMISKAMGKKLELAVGDRITVMIQDSNNEIAGKGMVVEGFFQTPIETFDKYMVFVNIGTLQEITGLGESISEISILGSDKDSSKLIKNSLIKSLNDSSLEILAWEDMMPSLVSAIALFETMMIVFFLIVFITVVFSVANTLVMSIMERFHEIGVMKSIGTRPVQIFNIVVFEAINLGIVGLFTGVIISSIFVGILSVVGIDLSMMSESMRALGSGSVLYPFLTIKDIITSTILVLLTTFLAALYPAIKAARIKPLDALNYI